MEKKIKGTAQQIEVLESDTPVKRVIACAGSGKTWVLTGSIVNILKSGRISPDEVLALTFTKNAAENMRKRVMQSLGDINISLYPDIYTFNSFGNEIIYENSFELGLGKDFRMITSSQSWQLLYKVFKKVNISHLKIGNNPGVFLQKLLAFIQDVKNNIISLGDFRDYIKEHEKILGGFKSKALRNEEMEITGLSRELFEIYLEYEEIKSMSNVIDYADQVFLPYSLLSKRKALREKYRSKYKYIFIDEFQDTNVAQARFLTLLYKKGHNKIMIVGDDDQGIYSFRGACVDNILDFDKWDCFRDDSVKNFYLSVNFRSGPEIIDSVQRIISENKRRFEKVFTAYDDKKESAVFFNIDQTLEDEAKSIAGHIKDIINNTGIKPGDIAIISRRKRFEKIIKALDKNGIKYNLIGSKNFYYEPEILFLVSWLKAIDNIYDELSMVYLLKSRKYHIGDRDIFFLKNSGPGRGKTGLVDGIRNCHNNKLISREAKERLRSFLESLSLYIKKSGVLDMKELISLIFEDSGLSVELKSGFGESCRRKLQNIESLIKIASDFRQESYERGYESFILYLKDVARTDYDDPDTMEISKENSVKIMSIHASKGLEFEAVIMPMLWKNDYLGRSNRNQGFTIPSSLRKDNGIWVKKKDFSSTRAFREELKGLKTEEERRIFYVACSRARKILLLSHSRFENREDADDEKKKPKEIVPFFPDLVRGNKHIRPLGAEAAEFLESIEGHGSINKSAEVIKLPGGKNIKIEVRQAAQKNYDWKSIEKKLASMAKMIEKDPGGGIKKYLSEYPDAGMSRSDIKEIREYISRSKGIEKMKICIRKETAAHRTAFSLTPLLDYLECPAMYKWKYVYSIAMQSDKKMMIGEDIHKFIERITILCSDRDIDDILKMGVPDGIKPYIETFLASRFARLSSDMPGKMFLERLFYFKTGDHIITGKIDRVDCTSKGIEIIDYKMSKGKTGDMPVRYKRQLMTYISAVSDIMEVPVKDIKGTLMYLGSGRNITIEGSRKSAGENNAVLEEAAGKIIMGEFDPIERSDCPKECEYLHLCRRSG